MKQERPETNVEPGEFPYPLVNGPEESRYLTWIRNHTNYLAERGLLDYFRLIAVLVRGILINFLTLLPHILVLSVLLGLLYQPVLKAWDNQVPDVVESEQTEEAKKTDDPIIEWFIVKKIEDDQRDSWAKSLQNWRDTSLTPFLVTPMVIWAALIWVLLFPIISRLAKVVGYKRSLETGSSSSVKLRDRYERSFGFCLILILATALIESFPLMVHFFHEFWERDNHWVSLPTAGGAFALLVGANKLFTVLGGAAKKVAMIAVGALGLLVPLILVLWVVEFVVYADPYMGAWLLWLIVIPVILTIGIIVAAILGIRSFKGKALGSLLLLLFAMLGLLLSIIVGFCVLIFQSDDVISDYANALTVLVVAIEVWIFCMLTVDVNLTSINGLYRDRLASSFLVGADTKGDVDIEQDIDLEEICNYDAGSTAPYHIVNVALNLQGSKDIAIRERNSDFFIFSKRYVGSDRTGYCRSEDLERVFPQIDLGTAMAISAAAASPNMGRATNPLVVAFMTLLNVRLGFWIPNPGILNRRLSGADDTPKIQFQDIFEKEILEIKRRREEAYPKGRKRPVNTRRTRPSTAHEFLGVGFSGGGIRSATVNLGIAQALHQGGLFDHIDFMSTVSGGGYLGSSLSTLMRSKTSVLSPLDGEIVSVKAPENGQKVVEIRGIPKHAAAETEPEIREYRYARFATLDEDIVEGAKITPGQRILRRGGDTDNLKDISLWRRFRWRVRPGALWREMLSMPNETHKWVNLSDGGHIENLAGIELLRRRCRIVILGDGECDKSHYFNGLATLIRSARLDLGIEIAIRMPHLHLKSVDGEMLSPGHFAVGKIHYPKDGSTPAEIGYLLYIKSSYTGDEDENIREYRNRNPDFPHQTTADQFFDEDQFEAYRSLGQHIGEETVSVIFGPDSDQASYADFESGLEKVWERNEKRLAAGQYDVHAGETH